MTVTSQRPLKILIRYKKRSLSSISLFLKVKWPSDSIKSGQLPTKCFGFGKYGEYVVYTQCPRDRISINIPVCSDGISNDHECEARRIRLSLGLSP